MTRLDLAPVWFLVFSMHDAVPTEMSGGTCFILNESRPVVSTA